MSYCKKSRLKICHGPVEYLDMGVLRGKPSSFLVDSL